MKSLTATAPGKIVLCGEYAVLDGAPAISAAVDRRARVDITETLASAAEADVIVTTIGFEDGEYRYRATDAGLEPARGQAGLSLFEAAWLNEAAPAGAAIALVLDTSPFFASGVKLGLGSSAALTVALVNALATWSGGDPGAALQPGVIHSRFQEGRGSGVDLATSTAGGMICFERQRADMPDGAATTRSRIRQVAWPGGLEAAVLFSGVAASTPAKLERLESRERLEISDVLAEAAGRAADAWQRGVVGAVLDATARFSRALADFSDAYDLDVFGGGHAALAELAETQGLVYKPCGAGGGDTGVVLGDDAATVAQFVERAAAAGFDALEIHLGGKTDVEGLTVEWTHD